MSGAPAFLHVDTGRALRGGQFQALLLHEGLLGRGARSLMIAPPDSVLAARCREHGLPFAGLPLAGEADLRSARGIAGIAERERGSGFRPLLLLHDAHAVGIGRFAQWFDPALPSLAVRRVDFPLRRGLFSRLKYGAPGLRRIVCVSDAIRARLAGQGLPPARLATIRDAIRLPVAPAAPEAAAAVRRALAVPPGGPLVGTVAALTAEKGIPDLVEALALAREALPAGARFVVAGEGPDRAAIERRAALRGVADRLTLPGGRFPPTALVPALDLFALPSRAEGLGSILLLAQAHGVPVLATAAGGIPELVRHGETGWLVPPGDPARLASALVGLLKARPLARRLAERGRAAASAFSLDRAVDAYLALAGEILAERNPG